MVYVVGEQNNMDIQKITGAVGTIQRIVDNNEMTIGYKLSRIKALIGTINVQLELLNNGQEQNSQPITAETF